MQGSLRKGVKLRTACDEADKLRAELAASKLESAKSHSAAAAEAIKKIKVRGLESKV